MLLRLFISQNMETVFSKMSFKSRRGKQVNLYLLSQHRLERCFLSQQRLIDVLSLIKEYLDYVLKVKSFVGTV